ncbi:DUF6893 family small protein [Streptomyces humicola]
MKKFCVTAVVAAVLAAVIVPNIADIKRYLRIRSM